MWCNATKWLAGDGNEDLSCCAVPVSELCTWASFLLPEAVSILNLPDGTWLTLCFHIVSSLETPLKSDSELEKKIQSCQTSPDPLLQTVCALNKPLEGNHCVTEPCSSSSMWSGDNDRLHMWSASALVYVTMWMHPNLQKGSKQTCFEIEKTQFLPLSLNKYLYT